MCKMLLIVKKKSRNGYSAGLTLTGMQNYSVRILYSTRHLNGDEWVKEGHEVDDHGRVID